MGSVTIKIPAPKEKPYFVIYRPKPGDQWGKK